MMHSKTRSLAAVGGLMMAGAVLAGCGGGSGRGHAGSLADAGGTGSVATTTVPARTTTAPANPAPAVTAPDAGSTGPAKCTTAELSVTLAGTQGAAGSTISDLVFTNRGSAPCTMTGYPGVSLVAGSNGTQVGATAARSAVAPVNTITVQPGAAATAELRQAQAGNFPASACHPISTGGFRVYPPNNTAAAFVAFPGRGCANPSLGQPQLFIAPVTTGTAPSPSTSGRSQPAPAATGPTIAGPALIVRSFDGTVAYDGQKPSTIGFSRDSTNIVTHLTWSSWGTGGAAGHGQMGENNCVPNCATGTVTQVPATVTLSNVVGGHFTAMTERAGSLNRSFSYPSDWATSAS